MLKAYKSPKSLTYIRHGESAYNAQKKNRSNSSKYNTFEELFNLEFKKVKESVEKGNSSIPLIQILNKEFPSVKLKELALELLKERPKTYSPFDTPLSQFGQKQCRETGMKLKERNQELPDIIYISPYIRTEQTLKYLIEGWSELGNIPVKIDPRLREQEYGTQILFEDRKLEAVFNPLEMLLREIETEYSFRHSNGESMLDVIDRHNLFLKHIYRKNIGEKVMVIGHHLGLLSLKATFENWNREKFLFENKNNSPENSSITEFAIDNEREGEGKLITKRYNEILWSNN
jgi:broad specificity phosphatase PhoE